MRTLHVTVGYLPQPFATPEEVAAGADVWSVLAQLERVLADGFTVADDAIAVLTPSGAVFGGNFGGNF